MHNFKQKYKRVHSDSLYTDSYIKTVSKLRSTAYLYEGLARLSRVLLKRKEKKIM